jgi:hypothetical protein
MATPKFAAVPDPSGDPESLRQVAVALKENVEVLTSQRGPKLNAAVTWQDLVDLKLILPTQVPHK